MGKIPTVVVTDSNNLVQAIESTSLVADPWLRPDIAVVKEAVENKTVNCVRWVCSADMLADCLTKMGATAEKLLEVMSSGMYELPGGWPDKDETV